jgi:MFS family permease
MDSKVLTRAMRWSIADGALATAMGTLTSGVFLTGLALALGATRLQIGILAALPTLATVMQLPGSYLIERFGQRKWLCFWASLAGRLTWLPIIAIVLFPTALGGTQVVWLIAGLVALGSALGSLGGVAWLSWIRELIPDQHRIGFLSRRNFVMTLLALVLGMLVGAFLDFWNSAHPGSMGGFAILVGVAAAVGFCSSFCMAQVAERKTHRPPEPPPPFRRLVALPFRDANFRRVVLFYVTWNLSVNLALPFFSVYMLQQLELPFWYVTALVTLSSVVGLLANGFWARLKERFGVKPVVFLATAADAFVPLLWLFVDGPAVWMLLLIHFFGVFSAPLAIGPNTMVLRLAPAVRTSAYMAVFAAVVGPASALAAVVGGAIAATRGWSMGPVSVGGLQMIFFLSFAGRLCSLFILRKVTEPAAHSASTALAHVLGSISPARWSIRGKRQHVPAEPIAKVFRIPLRSSAKSLQAADYGDEVTSPAK